MTFHCAEFVSDAIRRQPLVFRRLIARMMEVTKSEFFSHFFFGGGGSGLGCFRNSTFLQLFSSLPVPPPSTADKASKDITRPENANHTTPSRRDFRAF
jgi:hypothetical protein